MLGPAFIHEKIPEDEVIQRLLFPMINEAFNILDEGMAQRPSDIDVCYVHGYRYSSLRRVCLKAFPQST